MRPATEKNLSIAYIDSEIAHWRQSIVEVTGAISDKNISRLRAELRFERMQHKSETLANDLKSALSEDRNLDALRLSLRLAHTHLGCKLLEREIAGTDALSDLFLSFQKGAIDQLVYLEKYVTLQGNASEEAQVIQAELRQKIDSNHKLLDQLVIEAEKFNSTGSINPLRCLYHFLSEEKLNEFAKDLTMRVRRGLPVSYTSDQAVAS